jgi:hypothetical protein
MPRHVREAKGNHTQNKPVSTPATLSLFKVKDNVEKLTDEESAVFHSTVAKLLYISARVSPEISVAVAYLTTRVQCPTKDDEIKLARLLNYIKDERTILSPTDDANLTIYVDSSFATHDDLKSHSGGAIYYKGCLIRHWSKKQKVVTRSTTESELVAVTDAIPEIDQALSIIRLLGEDPKIVVFQDNKAVITLITAGGGSLKTKYLKVRQAVAADWIKSNDVVLEYCPTGNMIADVLTKPLQGELFRVLSSKLNRGERWDRRGALVEPVEHPGPNHVISGPNRPGEENSAISTQYEKLMDTETRPEKIRKNMEHSGPSDS